jgi:hypothetical protein
MEDDIYYQKYLKYKTKYLELKKQEGGLSLKSGLAYIFTSKDNANKLEALFKRQKKTDKGALIPNPPNRLEIDKLLDGNAYTVWKGEKVMYLNESLEKTASKVASKALEKGKVIGAQVLEKGKEIGQEVAKQALEKGKVIGAQALEKGKEVGQELAKQALEKGKVIGAQALEKGKEIGSQALEKGKELAKQALEKDKEVKTQGLKNLSKISNVQTGGENESAAKIDISDIANLDLENKEHLKILSERVKEEDVDSEVVVVIKYNLIGKNQLIKMIDL